MVLGRRNKECQQALFVTAGEVRVLGNPFYRALNRLLDEYGFDGFVEDVCGEFYAERRGRPSVAPGVYFRMLMVGYLEGIASERGIAWRCADSISLREFLGYDLYDNPPEHSGLSETRKRLSVEAHTAVFTWVLKRLHDSGLLRGETLGVDSTTLEANAAMRTIVRRDDEPPTNNGSNKWHGCQGSKPRHALIW
ncbi:MAG: transposase [Acidimicrobiaceae bacterium]|nr:transposase [Acidimicrobiaceae bacterium]